MKIIDVKNSLPKEDQSLFGLDPDTKRSLSESLTTNINDLLKKRTWTVVQAAKIYLYLLIQTQTSSGGLAFYNKHKKTIDNRTNKILSSAENETLRIYSAYMSLFSCLRLMQEKINFCELTAKTAHMILLSLARTAIRCEHVLSHLKEEARTYLYPISLDQFTPDKNKDWNSNIKDFELAAIRIKEALEVMIHCNKTLKLISESIDMKTILLLVADLTDIIGRVDRLSHYVSKLKKDIETGETIDYASESEKKTKIEVVGKLLGILNDNEDLISSINDGQFPAICKEGINVARMIKDIG